MLKQRILATALTAVSALALSAGPAAAHVNAEKQENVAEQAGDRQGGVEGGVIAKGFIGPGEAFLEGTGAGSDAYVTAHSGMECGALSSPNIDALGPASVVGTDDNPFDARFVCPAGK